MHEAFRCFNHVCLSMQASAITTKVLSDLNNIMVDCHCLSLTGEGDKMAIALF